MHKKTRLRNGDPEKPQFDRENSLPGEQVCLKIKMQHSQIHYRPIDRADLFRCNYVTMDQLERYDKDKNKFCQSKVGIKLNALKSALHFQCYSYYCICILSCW